MTRRPTRKKTGTSPSSPAELAWVASLQERSGVAINAQVGDALGVLYRASRVFSTVLAKNPERYLPVVEAAVGGAQAPDPGAAAAEISLDLSQSSFDRELRRVRYGESLDIVLRELLGLEAIETTLSRISALAEALIERCHRYVWKQADVDPEDWIVLAYGKLGAGDLNLSSDVDLGILCLSDDKIHESTKILPMVRRFGDLLSRRTEDGFAYRVDWRLRPGGSASPLVRSVSSYLRYYEQHQSVAERLPLLRMRAVAGNFAAFDDLRKRLAPLVYRRATTTREIGMLHALKRKIELAASVSARTTSVATPGTDEVLGYNLKLGRGGIRDIEFFVNALQLLFGGRIPLLQEPVLGRAVVALYLTGLVDERETVRIRETYSYYRRLEHRLHVRDERQAFVLPDQPEDLDAFFRGLDLEPAKARRDLSSRRREIRELFDRLVLMPVSDMAEATLPLLLMVIDDATPAPEVAERLRAEGAFRVDEAFVVSLRREASGPDSPLHPASLERDLVFGVNLFKALVDSLDPGEAVEQLHRILPALWLRPYMRAVLREDPLRLKLFIDGAVQCPFVRGALTREPAILDQVFLERAGEDSLLEMARGSAPERRLELLHRWFVVERVRCLMTTLRDARSLAAEGRALTEIADRALGELVDFCVKEQAGEPLKASWAIVALGSYGARELRYCSDLDLIFLHDGEGWEEERRVLAFFRRLVSVTAGHIESRRFFDVDTRIRPEGSRGGLITSVAAFERYHEARASTWEKMALLRGRVVAGIGSPVARFEELRARVLSDLDPDELRSDVLSLRERRLGDLAPAPAGSGAWIDVKFSPGGLLDLDVLVQALSLARRPTRFPSDPRLEAVTVSAAIESLRADGDLAPEIDLEGLAAAAALFHSVEQCCDLYFPERARRFPDAEGWPERVELRRAFLYPKLPAGDLNVRITRAREVVERAWAQVYGA